MSRWATGSVLALLVVAAAGCVSQEGLDPDKPLPGELPTEGQPPPSCGLGSLQTGEQALYLHVIDVGQGDALLIQTPDDGIDGNGVAEGYNILIDAGNLGTLELTDGGDYVVDYLRRLGVRRLDYAIVTHAHADHYGGMLRVMEELTVVNVVDPGYNDGGLGELPPAAGGTQNPLDVHNLHANYGHPEGFVCLRRPGGSSPWTPLLGDAKPGSASGGGGGGEGAQAFAPEVIRMQGARLQLRDRRARMPEVVLESRSLQISSEELAASGRIGLSGDVQVQGVGPGQIDGAFDLRANTVRLGVTLDAVTDLSEFVRNAGAADVLRRAKVQARGVEVAWPLAVNLREVHLGALALPWLWTIGDSAHTPLLDAMDARELGVRLDAESPVVTATDATVHLRDGEALLAVPLGDATLKNDLAQGIITLDIDRKNAGDAGAATLHLEWDTRDEQITGSARLDAFELKPYAPLMPAAAVSALDIASGRATGSIRIDALLAEDILDLDVDGTLDDGTFRIPALAATQLEDASVGLKGKLQLRRSPARLQLEGGRVRLGELEGSLDAHLEQAPDGLVVKLHLRSPELDAGRLLSSLPRGFAPKLEGYAFEGTYGFNFNLEVDTRDPDALVLDGSLDLSRAKVVTYGAAAHLPTLNGDFAMHPAALPAHVQLGPLAEGWTPREEIPDVVIQAITSGEDGRFFEHDGFDPRGIRARGSGGASPSRRRHTKPLSQHQISIEI
jgi:hypothetical protein